jgi:hypothetical protein
MFYREMQARTDYGGFEFMPRPSDKYYRNLPEKVEHCVTSRSVAQHSIRILHAGASKC